jgi:hypothetical protein
MMKAYLLRNDEEVDRDGADRTPPPPNDEDPEDLEGAETEGLLLRNPEGADERAPPNDEPDETDGDRLIDGPDDTLGEERNEGLEPPNEDGGEDRNAGFGEGDEGRDENAEDEGGDVRAPPNDDEGGDE